jgi:hypothetical protein
MISSISLSGKKVTVISIEDPLAFKLFAYVGGATGFKFFPNYYPYPYPYP